VLLADLTVTFFTDEGEDVQLSASEGLLDTESNDIQVSGDVKVANEEYVLTTTGLLYRHATRIISSAAPVLIQRKAGGKLSADSMSLDLNSRLVTMEGNVTGVFDEPGDS
jgi:LPS export ABC transporter protein LptC